MPAAGGEGLEKIEDMIVRAAESTAAHVRAAKAAIGTVIFGQDKVVEQALVTILSGGHALLLGVPGLAKTKLVDTMGTVLGLDAHVRPREDRRRPADERRQRDQKDVERVDEERQQAVAEQQRAADALSRNGKGVVFVLVTGIDEHHLVAEFGSGGEERGKSAGRRQGIGAPEIGDN